MFGFAVREIKPESPTQNVGFLYVLNYSEKLVPQEGFEPPTIGLQNRCSTVGATGAKLKAVSHYLTPQELLASLRGPL